MSGWIDIRLGGPKESDANLKGDVYWLFDGDRYEVFSWCGYKRRLFSQEPIAWMPIPEFAPLPDPPEGWLYVQKQEPFDSRAKFLNRYTGEWTSTINTAYDQRLGYIVPIDPPAPTYRPFANATEFDPFAMKPWRYLVDLASVRRPPAIYGDKSHSGNDWEQSLATKIFCDGTPFGVEVEQ
jgi:hypothetical protein